MHYSQFLALGGDLSQGHESIGRRVTDDQSSQLQKNCRKAYLTRDEADEGDDDQRQSLPNRRHDIRVFKIFRKECKNEHFFFAGKRRKEDIIITEKENGEEKSTSCKEGHMHDLLAKEALTSFVGIIFFFSFFLIPCDHSL